VWRKRVSGFTFLEMVIVVALMGILATLSVASLSGMQPRMDVMGALDDLAATMARAQSRAQAQVQGRQPLRLREVRLHLAEHPDPGGRRARVRHVHRAGG